MNCLAHETGTPHADSSSWRSEQCLQRWTGNLCHDNPPPPPHHKMFQDEQKWGFQVWRSVCNYRCPHHDVTVWLFQEFQCVTAQTYPVLTEKPLEAIIQIELFKTWLVVCVYGLFIPSSWVTRLFRLTFATEVSVWESKWHHTEEDGNDPFLV